MSGFSSTEKCPICGEEMDIQSDYKPIDNVSGYCISCGFRYFTKTEQMSLLEINQLRKKFNENNDAKLKPLTQKEYKKWGKAIKDFY